MWHFSGDQIQHLSSTSIGYMLISRINSIQEIQTHDQTLKRWPSHTQEMWKHEKVTKGQEGQSGGAFSGTRSRDCQDTYLDKNGRGD
jgi:hypothetical protein